MRHGNNDPQMAVVDRRDQREGTNESMAAQLETEAIQQFIIRSYAAARQSDGRKLQYRFYMESRPNWLALKRCDWDETVQLTLKYLHDKNEKVLEAGCGLGRVVKYLHDRGFKQMSGIEVNNATVDFLNTFHPELDIRQGNILRLPYPNNTFDSKLWRWRSVQIYKVCEKDRTRRSLCCMARVLKRL